MGKNRVIYLGICVMMFWLMIMYNGWQTQAAFEVVLALPFLLAILNRFAARKFTATLDEQDMYCKEDGKITKYLFLKNRSFLPFLRIVIRTSVQDSRGTIQKYRFTAKVKGFDTFSYPMNFNVHHYGNLKIKIEKIELYDFFFLGRVRKKTQEQGTFFVYPPLDERLEFHIKAGSQMGLGDNDKSFPDLCGYNRNEVAQVEEYREGDSIRDIHWKLSSKNDTFMVKHFAREMDEKLYLCVDIRVEDYYRDVDGLLRVLQTLIESCKKYDREYELLGYDGSDYFPVEYTMLPERIKEGAKKRELPLHHFFEQHSGVFLTMEKNPGEVPPDMHLVVVDEAETEKKEYFLGEKNLIQIQGEEGKQETQPFVSVECEKERQYEKYSPKPDKKTFLMQVALALLASLLSVLSVYDIVYVEQEIFMPVMTTIFFVLYQTGICVAVKKEMAWALTWKNFLIFGGYLVILLIGGGTFVIDGVKELIDSFGDSVTVLESDYGLIYVGTEELSWLLVLADYAIVDVLFNFSVEFVLPVHLLVVGPLLSISYIVGAIPTAGIVFLAILYLALLVTFFHGWNYGRRKSSKEISAGIADIEKSTGAAGGIVLILALLVATVFIGYNSGKLYHRPGWMSAWKEAVNVVAQGGSLKNGMDKLAEETKKYQIAGERGVIDDTKAVSYTGDTVLLVKTINKQKGSFYLKSYVGSVYTKGKWEQRSENELLDEAQFLENMYQEIAAEKNTPFLELNTSYYIQMRMGTGDGIVPPFSEYIRNYLGYEMAKGQEDNYYIAGKNLELSVIQVISLLDEDISIHQPYFSNLNLGGEIEEDGFLTMNGGYVTNRLLSYEAYDTEDIEDFHVVDESAEREDAEDFVNVEKKYASYIREHYLDVPADLENILKPFRSASIVYHGQELKLSGDVAELQETGYEPYIQYVRQYFDKRNFTYKIDTVRENANDDFIKAFLYRKTGYCIHYASAAVMMFRSMGIPARYAEGFLVKSADCTQEGGNFASYEVPDNAAHAWVEIYENGVGWVPVEVTPGSTGFTVNYESIQKETKNDNPTVKQNETRETKAETEVLTKPAAEKEKALKKGNGSLSFLLIPAALVLLTIVIVLLRYLLLMYLMKKRLYNKKQEVACIEMQRQYERLEQYLQLEGHAALATEERAEKLAEKLDGMENAKEKLCYFLRMEDKDKYARENYLSEEEKQEMRKILRECAGTFYRQCKTREKIVYKYIKCLYLSDK